MTTSVLSALLSAILQVAILGGVPLLLYTAWQKWRHGRSFQDIRERTGLVIGDMRTLPVALATAALLVLILVVFPPPMEFFTQGENSPQKRMVGLGWSAQAWTIALSYGVLQTGLTEEFLFRGLLTGALQRRLPLWSANLVQALLFLVPHIVIVAFVGPGLWGILPGVFIGSLILGWERMKSGSILGPWIVHATANVTTCMLIAVQ